MRVYPPTFWSRMRLGAGISLLAVLTWLAYRNLMTPNCENHISLDSTSPDRTKRAVIFLRTCARLERYTRRPIETQVCSQVSILPTYSSLPNSEGNAFAEAWDSESETPAWVGAPPVRVRWLSDHELLVGYASRMKTQHMETEVNGVTVRYKPLE